MHDIRTSRPLLALIAAMAIGSGAALAQDGGGANGGADGNAGANADANSGKSQPLTEDTDQTTIGRDEGDYSSALERPDMDSDQVEESGQINDSSPAYQETHEDRENPSGPVQEPVE